MRVSELATWIARRILPESVYRMPPERPELDERSARAISRARELEDVWNERHQETWRNDGHAAFR